jgi:hypothetical protein
MVVLVASKLHKEELAGAALMAPRRPKLQLVPSGQTEITPYRGTELRQARQTYDPVELARLKTSVDQEGLMHPVQIAQLTEPAARYYLRIWNRVYGKRYKLEQISIGPTGRYEIVIAGHRRRLVSIELCEEGRPPKDYDIRFRPDISPEKALQIQIQENIYVEPETWENAENAYRFWVFLQEVEQKRVREAKLRGEDYTSELTLKSFSVRIGATPSTVRGYLCFGKAPKVLQATVRRNRIPYGKGVLLARLVLSGAVSEELLREHWLPMAALPGQSTPVFEKAIMARIEAARHLQDDLFGELDVNDVARAYESDRRATVFPELIGRLHETVAYLAAVRELDEAGRLGENGPYSDASPNRLAQKLVDEVEKTLPHLRRLTAKQRQHNGRVLAEAGALLSELREALPEAAEPILALPV